MGTDSILPVGFRGSECQRIIKSEFDLTSDPPTATVTSGKAKNRKTRTNPISNELAAELKKHMVLFLPNARAFPNMPKRRIDSEIIQADLAATGIPYSDKCGQMRDFHSLRKTFGTRLARHNVPLVVAQKLLAHSTSDLTANYYTMIMPEDKAVAVSKLPTLTGKTSPDADTLSKTGTIGMESFSQSSKSADRLGDRNAPNFDGSYWT